MKCPYCGNTIADNSVVCIHCENILRTPAMPAASEVTTVSSDSQQLPPPSGFAYYAQQPTYTHPQAPVHTPANEPTYDAPLSIGGFIGSLIVAALPIAGLIVLLVWICRKKTNENRRNLSVALLIVQLIALFFIGGASLAYYLINTVPFFYFFW